MGDSIFYLDWVRLAFAIRFLVVRLVETMDTSALMDWHVPHEEPLQFK